MDTRSQPALIRIALIGERNSGKSALVTRFMQNTFSAESKTTIGVDLQTHTIDSIGQLQLFDTAGDARYQTPFNFSNMDTVFITCDLTNAKSLNSIQQYLKKIDISNNNKHKLQIILVGTKADLISERQIDAKTFADAARGFNLPYIETSSQSGEGVTKLFYLSVANWQIQSKHEDKRFIDDIVITAKNDSRGFFRKHQNIIAYIALFVAIAAIIITLCTGIAAPLIAALAGVGIAATLAAIITHTIAFICGLLGGAMLGTAVAAIIDILPWRGKKSLEPENKAQASTTHAGVLKQMGVKSQTEYDRGIAFENEKSVQSARSEESLTLSSDAVIAIEDLTSSSSSSVKTASPR